MTTMFAKADIGFCLGSNVRLRAFPTNSGLSAYDPFPDINLLTIGLQGLIIVESPHCFLMCVTSPALPVTVTSKSTLSPTAMPARTAGFAENPIFIAGQPTAGMAP